MRADPMEAVQGLLKYRFSDPGLLLQSLTHASAKRDGQPSYERLEFFGDAVLGLVISEALFSRFPDLEEGDLTRMKSDLVSRPMLVKLGRELGLTRFLATGKGIARRSLPPSLLADAMEAVIAAVYLDGGIQPARALILRLYDAQLEKAPQTAANAKSSLQEVAQHRFGEAPTYALLSEQGPEHKKVFRVACRVAARELGRGSGKTKKAAEQAAAAAALAQIGAGDGRERAR